MASPQLEDGYFKIANEIAEALTRTNLSAYQSRVLWAIFRKTYGFKKKEDWISNGQMVEMTGLKKGHVSRTIRELKDRNLVTKGGNKIAFQKDYQRWRELPKGVTSHHELPRGVTPLPKGVTKVTKGGGHKIKQYTKDILRDPPDSRVTEFSKYHGEMFRGKFGANYKTDFAKDGAIIKRLLKTYSLEDLKKYDQVFFRMKDSFIEGSGYTLAALEYNIHKVLVESKKAW